MRTLPTTTPPEIANRPCHLTTERVMEASHDVLFRAWTEAFDRWCTESGFVTTKGTTLIVELTPLAAGTLLRLTHRGLPDQQARYQHHRTWPIVLAELDRHALAAGRARTATRAEPDLCASRL